MLKQGIIKLVVAIALMVAVTGATGVMADSLGLSVTPQVFACDDSGTSGGGC